MGIKSAATVEIVLINFFHLSSFPQGYNVNVNFPISV